MRPLVTTGLDLAGLLLVVLAVGLAVAAWNVPAGLASAGGLLLAASWLIDRRR